MDVETRDAMKKDAAECTRVLKDRFGYDTFREGQAEVVDALLSGRDAVGIMPTGGGKSICYQLPALLLPGVTVVVSPLISLMADQVRSLSENGIPAAFLNSSLNPEAFCDTVRAAAAGEYRLLYVAPERLDTAPFRELARNLDVSLVAVDEAHCISQWGQNFRPSYLNIADFITQMPRRPVVSAFTATATLRVREDIVAALGLRDPLTVVSGFNRPNLYFEVTKPQNKQKELLLYVKKRAGRCGIVYCSTRKTVEAVRELLARHGVSAVRYHAGLSDAERRRNQEDFLYDRADVMVATNAFGMGIDKPDARCDNCGNCHGAFEEVDATEWMRAALNCVHQICGRGWPYGKAMVCDVLKGAVNEKVRRARLADVRTFGLLTALPQRKILDVLDALEQDGFLAVSDGRYPTLTLGPEAERAREEGFRYMLRVPKRAPDADGNADATSEDLFETLRALRRRLAEGANVPAYVVFPDAALADMCRVLPQTEEEFLAVSGVGQAKLDRYGDAFLDAIRGYGLRGACFNYEITLDAGARRRLGQHRCFAEARKIGKRVRIRSPQFEAAHAALRSLLPASSPAPAPALVAPAARFVIE